MASSVAPGVDRSDLECELPSSSAKGGVEYPDSPELITESQLRLEREAFCPTSDTGPSESENSLFQAPCRYAPTRTRRKRRGQGRTSSLSALNVTSDHSSDSDYVPMSEKISEYLKKPFRYKWNIRKKTSKKKFSSKSKGLLKTSKGKLLSSIPSEEKRRRWCHPGIRFPFTSHKYLPFKLYFTYEQFVLGGFLNHVKNLKYERSLKESLKDLAVDEDLESESVLMREYSYLDDDGPISPISEPGESPNEEEEEVNVVENGSFILNCDGPSKKNWRIKKKGKKK
ncbi:TATA box-binding protein-associated factor RNA polymerase I subunit D [Dendropsophus ebraccatus]|uniref:TATA box-binding protein-associated factor RNA polymerase I subunit D n=1 Tax=Dendropsophus ebraccatus TaxID=150705 RepID=UPI003831276B